MKKKTIIVLVMLVIVVLGAVGYYHFRFIYEAPEAVSVRELQMTNEAYRATLDSIKADNNEDKFVVVINPSHGGADLGDSSQGVNEKDIVLRIAKYICSQNNNENMRIYLTRDADVNPTIEQRLSIINEANADIVIDIHLDNDTLSTATGLTAYYNDEFYNYHLTNEELADMLLRGMATRAENTARGVINTDDEKYAFLKGLKQPSVAISCGYVTNQNELMALKSDGYCRNLAEGILEGIDEAESRLR